MFDKSKRRATAQRCGDIVVIRMTGGPDCLWLNMYLDTEAWQMTCDSDIGSYSYHWPRGSSEYGFLELCTRWLANEEWLLRKCIGEYRVEKFFDRSATIEAMCEMFKEYYEAEADEDDEIPDYEGMLNDICYDDMDSWCAALVYSAPYHRVELPEEWWTHIAEDYTPWQKRFAEICREVIVPELEKMDGGKKDE